MSNVRMPIKTSRNGDEIVKVCIEDIYKILNRVQETLDKVYNNSIDIVDSVHKEYDNYEGELIIGTGVSKPCPEDSFDEETGNNIAFMKAKLNSNIKKLRLLDKITNQLYKGQTSLLKETDKIIFLIKWDLESLRKYNPDYLEGIEDKLNIY